MKILKRLSLLGLVLLSATAFGMGSVTQNRFTATSTDTISPFNLDLSQSLRSTSVTGQSLTIQDQTFTPGAAFVSTTINPVFSSENFAHKGLGLYVTQNSNDTNTLTDLELGMTQAVGGTLGTMVYQSFLTPVIAGAVNNVFGSIYQDMSIAGSTSSFPIRINPQSANATTTGAIDIRGNMVANAIRFNLLTNLYGSGSSLIMSDSSNNGGLNFGITSSTATVNSVSNAASILFQNQTFTPGNPFTATSTTPKFSAANFPFTGYAITATQDGNNTNTVTGLSVGIIKTTAVTTLATSNTINIASPNITGFITNHTGLNVSDQSSGLITNTWAIKTGLGNVEFGDKTGIGITPSSFQLEVNGVSSKMSITNSSLNVVGGGTAALNLENKDQTNTNSAAIQWLSNGNTTSSIAQYYQDHTISGESSNFVISTTNGGVLGQRFYISATGQVGINVSPTVTLQESFTDSATAARSDEFYIDHFSSGVTATGFGSKEIFRLQNAAGTMVTAGGISASWGATPTAGVEAGLLFLSVENSGTYTDRARLSGLGLQLGTIGGATGAQLQIIQPALSVAAGPAILVTGAAHTGQTASTEYSDINFNLNRTVTFATGALATERAFKVTAPTYDFVASSTITDAATFAITGSPVAGANAIITKSHALWVQAGQTDLDGALKVTGNVAFFGTTPQAQQASGANLTNSVTSGGTTDTINDITIGVSVNAADGVTTRNAIYQLARKLKQVNDALRVYGLLN